MNTDSRQQEAVTDADAYVDDDLLNISQELLIKPIANQQYLQQIAKLKAQRQIWRPDF